MSSQRTIVVRLPPSPTLLRDLIVTSLAIIRSTALSIGANVNVRLGDRADTAVIKTGVNDWEVTIGSVRRASLDILNLKISKKFRAPRLNINDYNYIFKKLSNKGLSKNSTYIDAFKSLLENNELLQGLLNINVVTKELGSVTTQRGSIIYGSRGYPLPQIFKVEMYERGLAFHRVYTADFSVRVSSAWLLLLAIAFSHTYAGSFDGKLSFITLSDEALISNTRFSVAVMLASVLTKVATDPVIPYVLYVSLLMPDIVRRKSLGGSGLSSIRELLLSDEEADVLKNLACGGELPQLNLHVLGIGRAYTALSRIPLNYSHTLKFAYVLDEVLSECRKELSNVVSRALGAVEPKLINVVTLLYEALNHAKDPTEATYVLVRTMRELSDVRAAPLISGKCVEAVITSIERV